MLSFKVLSQRCFHYRFIILIGSKSNNYFRAKSTFKILDLWLQSSVYVYGLDLTSIYLQCCLSVESVFVLNFQIDSVDLVLEVKIQIKSKNSSLGCMLCRIEADMILLTVSR